MPIHEAPNSLLSSLVAFRKRGFHPIYTYKLSHFTCFGHEYRVIHLQNVDDIVPYQYGVTTHRGKLSSCKEMYNRLCGLVVRDPGYRSRGPVSIPGANRFSEKKWVWNEVHSAS
jgi:hypothetical protein